jgi:3-deoxy-D-manno-octulosonic-acid transferase
MLAMYRLIWWIFMPVVLIYLYLRSRREPEYFKFLGERFGHHQLRKGPHIWIHAVSLGEVRSAAPLIAHLLEGPLPIVITHFTPAGRREVARLFSSAVADGRLTPCYIPFDYDAAFKRFFNAFSPTYGLVMEVEFWPAMIMSSRKRGIPLYLCNGQYPSKSFERDQSRLFSRANIVSGFAGVMVKSQLQAGRFRKLGVKKIAVTGEMRFEQPIPQAHLNAAHNLCSGAFAGRPIITLASVVEGEDDRFLTLISKVQAHFETQNEPAPLFIYVPRAPDRFDLVADMIVSRGFRYAKRSAWLDPALHPRPDKVMGTFDILLGDSLGEMYFYLELCDLTIVGGGFSPKGSHNISEPICLKKPVIIGPNDYTIEFPAREAIAAGVCLKMDFDNLAEQLTQSPLQFTTKAQLESFLENAGGGTAKTIAAIKSFLPPTSH